MNLDVGHPAHIKCPGKPYALSSTGAVTLPTAGTAGDCVHDALSAHGGSIESIFYNSSADAIHVDVTVLYFVSVKMTLTADGATRDQSITVCIAGITVPSMGRKGVKNEDGTEQTPEPFAIEAVHDVAREVEPGDAVCRGVV